MFAHFNFSPEFWLLILSNVTKTVNCKTTSHLSLCRKWEMSTHVAWNNKVPSTSCASWWSRVCFTGVSPFGKGTCSLLLALSFYFPHYLNYFWFLIKPSTFLFPLILSAERLRISPAVLTHTFYGQLKRIAVLQIRVHPSRKPCVGTAAAACKELQVSSPSADSLPLQQQQKCRLSLFCGGLLWTPAAP